MFLNHSFVSRYSSRSKRKMDPSNATLNKANLNAPFREPITAEIFSYINLVLKLIVSPTLGLAAILLNIINMVAFHRMGLSDGVAQNFFILAVCDGLYATTSLINKILLMLRTFIRAYIGYYNLEMVIQIVYQASFYSIPFPHNYSMFTTVVIAVVRCCCVAMPLKVKHLLTPKRQVAAILFLSGIATSVSVSVVAPLNIYYISKPAKNITEAYFRGARWPIYTIYNNIASFGSFIICIACVIILSTSLSKASRFRGSSTISTPVSTDNGKTSASDSKAKERQRNARVVRTVVLVSFIFIVCNVPTIVLYLLKAFVKGYEPGGQYQFANWFTILVAEMFLLISACLNTIIYFFYNTRYRNIFINLFAKKSETAKVFS